MSADNGIYLLKTLAPGTEGYEYRVAHAMGIDNLYYLLGKGEYSANFIPQEAFRYFGGCEVFADEGLAFQEAQRLASQQPLLEYGICSLAHSDQVFQTFTEEEMEFYDAEAEAQMVRARTKRSLERDQKLATAQIPLPVGTRLRVAVLYCYWQDGAGQEIHGSLYQPKNFEYQVNQEGFTFLPSDWNKE